MKILCSADYHIKLNTKNIPNEWSINRYNILFDRIYALESTVDAHFIMGDFFDKLPNMEELEIYFKFISKIKIPTYIISGNHEAVKKNTTFLTNLKRVTKLLNNNVEIIDDIHYIDNIDIIPYNRLKDFVSNYQDYDFQGDILISHIRAEIPPHVKPEIPLQLLDKWKVVLAGDLHSYDNCQRNILYPGSPVTTSFHRNLVDTGVIIFDSDTLAHEWVKLDVPQLIRKTIQVGEEMLPDRYHHVIYEVEGDLIELAEVEDHELLDKKITKKNTEDTALILSAEMTLEAEVVDYLRYIQQVSDDVVEKALIELNDNIKNS